MPTTPTHPHTPSLWGWNTVCVFLWGLNAKAPLCSPPPPLRHCSVCQTSLSLTRWSAADLPCASAWTPAGSLASVCASYSKWDSRCPKQDRAVTLTGWVRLSLLRSWWNVWCTTETSHLNLPLQKMMTHMSVVVFFYFQSIHFLWLVSNQGHGGCWSLSEQSPCQRWLHQGHKDKSPQSNKCSCFLLSLFFIIIFFLIFIFF